MRHDALWVSNRNARTVLGRLGALVLTMGLLATGACTNPVGLDDAGASAEHTTGSGNHTVSSGNHTVSSGNASPANR